VGSNIAAEYSFIGFYKRVIIFIHEEISSPIFFFIKIFSAEARHIAGGEMYYEWLGGRYKTSLLLCVVSNKFS
jgi:hypothetical protein